MEPGHVRSGQEWIHPKRDEALQAPLKRPIPDGQPGGVLSRLAEVVIGIPVVASGVLPEPGLHL